MSNDKPEWLNEFAAPAIDHLEEANLLLEVLSQSLEKGEVNNGRYRLVELIRERVKEASLALSPA